MRIGRSLAALLIMLLSWVYLPAQTNTRPVRGLVQDENGRIVSGVTITTEQGETSTPNEDGSFEIRVPFQCRTLSFSAQFYTEAKMDVDGSYLLVRLKYDKAAEEKARKEVEAKLKAEQEQKAREEKERQAAEEKARKEAEAKVKAEEKAREEARKEAEAKAKAEEKARIKAEQDRQAAAEEVRKQAEAKAEAEKKAIIKAEKKAEKEAAARAYSTRFKNKGLEHNVSLSYAYNFGTFDAVYKYSGMRSYGNLHPVELDYTLSYKFNRSLSLGAGAGIMYNLRSVSIIGDEFVDYMEGFQENRMDIPAFLSFKFRPFLSAVRPYAEIRLGYFFLYGHAMAQGTLGVDYRTSKSTAINFGAFAMPFPYPPYSDIELALGAKLGFSF